MNTRKFHDDGMLLTANRHKLTHENMLNWLERMFIIVMRQKKQNVETEINEALFNYAKVNKTNGLRSNV